jgi:hypothetical protein
MAQAQESHMRFGQKLADSGTLAACAEWQNYAKNQIFLTVILHSTDKAVRDKAVKVVTRWLSKQKEIGEEDLRKLWKGLYFCTYT